jgi:Tol biopolymer transport system component
MPLTRSVLCSIVALICAVAVTATAQRNAAASAPAQLRQAIDKETVDGDLQAAIKRYQAIADANAKGDRAVAAQALLRLAAAYEKTGQAQARTTYERVVREFGDQKSAVAEATNRLAKPTGTSNVVLQQRVWSPPRSSELYARVSRDGRYLAYTDWDQKGDLFIRDLAAGTGRRLTNDALQASGEDEPYAEEAAFSRDGRQLAYAWFTKDRYQLRVVPTDGAGIPGPRILVDNPEIEWIWPEDWSADGRLIAVGIQRRDRTAQIGLVSVQDRSLRVLKSLPWRGFMNMGFSPDGRYLAYDVRDETTNSRDLFVLAVDGTAEAPLNSHGADDEFVAWSRDGATVLFTSDRSASPALWRQGVSNGRSQGSPRLIKSDLGEVDLLGLTDSGTLFMTTRLSVPSPSEIRKASFDFDTGQFKTPTTEFVASDGQQMFQPRWSVTNRQLAYLSISLGRTSQRSDRTLRIFDVASGQTRSLRLPLTSFSIVWHDQGREILAIGTSFEGRQGVYRVDLVTGAISSLYLARPGEQVFAPRWGSDGSTMFFRRLISSGPVGRAQNALVQFDAASGVERELIRGDQVDRWSESGKLLASRFEPEGIGGAIVERDAASGAEREIFRHPDLVGYMPVTRFGGEFGPAPSLVAILRQGTSRIPSVWMLVNLAGDVAPRELLRVNPPDRLSLLSISRDFRTMLIRKHRPNDDGKRHELWRVGLPGGVVSQVDVSKWPIPLENIPVTNGLPGAFAFMTDSDVIFEVRDTSPRPAYEVLTLENFLPAAAVAER